MRSILQHIHKIVDSYEGEMPLNLFLKNYFRKHPILGSRDRKMLSEMAFAWYRCSKALNGKISFEKKLEICLFICETQVHQVLQFLKPEWQGKHDYFLPQKLGLLEKEKIKWTLAHIFPFAIELSQGILLEDWLLSMLKQPDLFIRYRKDTQRLTQLLNEHTLPYRQLTENCFALPNATKLQDILPEKDYAVQDASSQKTGNYFKPKPGETWWDCCSGAGGKSLLLKDIQPKVKLTVSDKRESIIQNLKKRYALYFKTLPESIIADMTDASQLRKQLQSKQFDHIICDAPCSGSGTWARTPEQLYFFDDKKLDEFSALQRTIAQNALVYLKPGGTLIYITCSVFKKENETVIQSLTNVDIEHHELINGMDHKADSMFVAVLRKQA
ncbi:MAG TPA: hypothetical protein VL098_13650 [Flavipsychrobacter sp.]|nr:hypothetical protein [Flavipsychrobacter sp.]